MVPIVLIATLLIAAALAWAEVTRPLDDDPPGVFGRGWPGFMAILGAGLSLTGAMVVAAQWIPVFYLNPCIRT